MSLRRLKSRLGAFAWILAAALILWEIAGLVRGLQLAAEAAPVTYDLASTGYDRIAATPLWVQLISWAAVLLIFAAQAAVIWFAVRTFRSWRRKRIKNP